MSQIKDIVFFILLCLFSYSCGNVDGNTAKASEEESTVERVFIGNLGLSLDIPFKFDQTNFRTQISSDLNDEFRTVETYTHNEAVGSYIKIRCVEYYDNVDITRLKVIDDGVDELTGADSSDGLISRTDDDIIVDDNAGTVTEGLFSVGQNEKFGFYQAVFSREGRLYQIMGVYEASDIRAKQRIENIVKSISIKN